MPDTVLFDKLAYLDRLKRAGIEDDQARAHAEAMEDALRESVATKVDVATLGTTIQSEVGRLETKISRLETKIESEVTRLENTIHSEVTRLETKIESVETKIDLAVRDMTIRMGAIAVALFAALASIKFFG